jgi:hypothetical protein
MLDTNSRYTIATRMNEERLAEARRAHLLRVARDERQGYEAAVPVVVAHPGVLQRALAGATHAVRQLTHGPARTTHPAALR